jgi:hypothetical protein
MLHPDCHAETGFFHTLHEKAAGLSARRSVAPGSVAGAGPAARRQMAGGVTPLTSSMPSRSAASRALGSA